MRGKQAILINLLAIVIVVVGLVGGYIYFYNQNHYVTENDARVATDIHYVAATVAGKVTKWTATEGEAVSAGDVLGVEQLPTGASINLTAPVDGQVLKSEAIVGQVVAPGAILGVVGNLANEYISVDLKETKLKDVKVGQSVDIYLDAFPGTTFTGTVERIGSESASAESPFPSSQSDGNFVKEVQRVPLTISISGKQGKYIIPGMNASVRIHQSNN